MENGIVLGQCRTEEKSNEITAIPELLKQLELKGCIATIDAMGTQTKIAETIISREADYILQVKENQPRLYEDISLYFKEEVLLAEKKAMAKKGCYYKEYSGEHGRIEERYNARTSAERSNKREKLDFKLEYGRHRSTKMWYCRLYHIMMLQHLDAWDLPFESALRKLIL